MGVFDMMHAKFAPRASFVPFFAFSGSFGLPIFTVNRYPPFSITGSTYASLPSLVESMKVDTSGTSTSENAGLGLLTVRAQSQAMTVRFWPRYGFRSGRSATMSAVISTCG